MLFLRDMLTLLLCAVVGVLLLALLPVIAPIALVLCVIEGRKIGNDAERFHCPDCGSIVGRAGVRLADKAWALQLAELQKQTSRRKSRRQPSAYRWLHAICPHCGMRFSYLSQTRRFRAELKAAPHDADADKRD